MLKNCPLGTELKFGIFIKLLNQHGKSSLSLKIYQYIGSGLITGKCSLCPLFQSKISAGTTCNR